ncbi:MAG TPA: mechanosensitive ion channel domain-containing protein [Candidatus Dormibacteraeota bacterium]|nr:mechanosensitive ion channel domain-containing protein [Candidatus Dormibacteraeota bacterium]
MSSYFTHWPEFSLSNGLHLIAILVVALPLIRFLRSWTNSLIHVASSQSRAAQHREQQTRALANLLYGAGCKVVWAIVLVAALPEFGINILPLAIFGGLTLVAIVFGAQNLLRDLIAGFSIVFEDQFTVGDLVQVSETTGRVEQVTLRRTMLRDSRGALVTVANGDIRFAGNLSRDWSQTFLDVSFPPETAMDRILQALETVTAELRNDSAWSQTLVDGPRILGVQNFDRDGAVVRIQIRTVPTRQDEVSRELRRRIHVEFQRQGLLFPPRYGEYVPAAKHQEVE